MVSKSLWIIIHFSGVTKAGNTIGIKGFGIISSLFALICSTVFTLRVLSGIRKRKCWNETEAKKEQSTIEYFEN